MSENPAGFVGLRWAVKESFTTYLARMPDGRMSLSEGATLADNQEVVWEPDPKTTFAAGPDADRTMAFRGDVRYGGHGGLLFVQVANPVVTLRGAAGDLTVVDTFSEVEGARITLVTFTVAKLIEAPGFEMVVSSDVRLTERGTHLFNDVYQTDEQFEQLSIVWPTTDQDLAFEQHERTGATR